MITSGGSEFSAWLRKPYNRRIFRYYLTEIIDKYQANGPELEHGSNVNKTFLRPITLIKVSTSVGIGGAKSNQKRIIERTK